MAGWWTIKPLYVIGWLQSDLFHDIVASDLFHDIVAACIVLALVLMALSVTRLILSTRSARRQAAT